MFHAKQNVSSLLDMTATLIFRAVRTDGEEQPQGIPILQEGGVEDGVRQLDQNVTIEVKCSNEVVLLGKGV
jgi:hypothetical protein